MKNDYFSFMAGIQYFSGRHGHSYHIVIAKKIEKPWNKLIPGGIICQGGYEDEQLNDMEGFTRTAGNVLCGLDFGKATCPVHFVKKLAYEHFKNEYPDLKKEGVHARQYYDNREFCEVWLDIPE